MERWGRRRALPYTLAGYAIGALGYFVAESLTTLLAVRVIHGVAFGSGTTAVMTVAQSLIPRVEARRGHWLLHTQ